VSRNKGNNPNLLRSSQKESSMLLFFTCLNLPPINSFSHQCNGSQEANNGGLYLSTNKA